MTAAATNKDGLLSIAEFKTLDLQALHHGHEHFTQGDTNQGGAIDGDELPGALQKQTWFAILSEGTEACFRRLDSNQDAKLDVEDFRQISKTGAHTEQHFRGADSDKDGFLSLAESKLKALEAGPSKKNKPRSIGRRTKHGIRPRLPMRLHRPGAGDRTSLTTSFS